MVRALTFLVLLILFESARAASSTVLVLYPDAPPPYRLAFEQIIAGIEHSASGAVDTLTLPTKYNLASIERWLISHQDSNPALVLLGQRALGAYTKLSTKLPALVGGINRVPGGEGLPGVSMVIEPSLFIDSVHDLLPSTKTIITFYHPRHRALLALIDKAAAQRGLQIQPIAVTDAQTAVKEIGRVFETIDPHITALWFTKDTISLNPELILPFVLEESWKRRIAVFSETVSHTKRGFLFSLYPDYYGMGTEIGSRIQDLVTGRQQGLSLTRAARYAVNTRTARHLGIPLHKGVTEKADVLFPAP